MVYLMKTVGYSGQIIPMQDLVLAVESLGLSYECRRLVAVCLYFLSAYSGVELKADADADACMHRYRYVPHLTVGHFSTQQPQIQDPD